MAWARAGAGALPVPPDSELLWHALSHSLATIDFVAYPGLRLRHWLDAAALIGASSHLDWELIRRRVAADECEHPALARAWLRVAFELSGDAPPPFLAATTPPLDLVRLLAWRMEIGSAEPNRWQRKLLEEGTRAEAGLPLEQAAGERGALIRARHGFAAAAARLSWRLQA